MDLMIALVALAAIIILTIAVYLLSTVPMKGKTFEEAVAEQRKQDELLFPDLDLSDKTSKDRKHKKVVVRRSKEHEDSEKRPRRDSDKPTTEAPPPKDTKRRKSPSPSPPKQIKEAAVKEKIQPVSVNPGNHGKEQGKKEKVDNTPPKKDAERKVEVVEAKKTGNATTKKEEQVTKADRKKEDSSGGDSSDKDARPNSRRPQKSASAEAIPVHIGVTGAGFGAPAPKRAKRTKGDVEGVGSSEVALNATRLAKLLKNAILSGPDVQMLVDLLLTQTQAGSGPVASRHQWQQRGQKDSLETLQEKLAKKEEQLEEERLLTQSAAAKLKDVRQEVTQEKNRTALLDRTLKQRLLELQNLQTQLTTAQQAKSKLSEEHEEDLKKAAEECHKLRQTANQHEAELKLKLDSEVNLRKEMEQLQRAHEQSRKRERELKAQNKKFEASLQKLQEEEKNLQERISEITKELGSADSERNDLQQEIESLRARSASADNNNNVLQIQLDELHVIFNAADNARRSLEGKLQETDAQLAAAKAQIAEANNEIADARTAFVASQDETKFANARLQELQKKLQETQEKLANEQKMIAELSRTSKENEKLLSEKVKLADELSGQVATSDGQAQELYSELKVVKEENSSLKRDLEMQRAKNDELRQKNWKTVDALNAAEKMASENMAKVKSAIDAETLLQEREKEQAAIKRTLNKIFPNLRIEKKSCDLWLPELEKDVCAILEELGQYKEKSDKCSSQVSDSAETQQKLELQVQHYQTVLAETEGILNKLQSSVEAEEQRWKGEFNTKEIELMQLRKSVKNLEDEKLSLETSLEEIRAAEETASEMQEKLCELQYKLQIEESEKRSLVSRCEKAESDSSQSRDKVESGMQAYCDVQCRLADTLVELDSLKEELEKERKLYKELSTERARLNGLVKIGQDSLREEQERSNSLQVQLDRLKKNPAINGLQSENIIAETELPSVRNDPPNSNSSASSAASKNHKSKKRFSFSFPRRRYPWQVMKLKDWGSVDANQLAQEHPTRSNELKRKRKNVKLQNETEAASD